MITVVNVLPPLSSCPPGTILGYGHYTLPGGRRLIACDAARELDGRIDTETGHARRWLATLPPQRRRYEEMAAAEAARPPLYCQPGYWGDCAYIDIEAAYPSIYCRIGWDAEYSRGRWWGWRSALSLGVPHHWKVARSMPVSLRGTGWIRYWDGGAVRARRIRNPIWSPGLRWATLDVLQALARVAVDVHGAVYVNTDGYVVPDGETGAMIARLADYGLRGRIRYQGPTYIANLHALSISDHVIGAGAARPLPYDGIAVDLRQAAWILGRFERLPLSL